MKKRNRTFVIEGVKVITSSDYEDGELFDTEIRISDDNHSVFDGAFLCSVAGNQRDEFLSELEQLIKKYKI